MTETQRLIALATAKGNMDNIRKELEIEQTKKMITPLFTYLRNPRNIGRQYECRYGIIRDEMVITNGNSTFALYRTFDFKKMIDAVEKFVLEASLEKEEALKDILLRDSELLGWNFEMHFPKDLKDSYRLSYITIDGIRYSFLISEIYSLRKILGENYHFFVSKDAPILLAQSSIGRAYVLGNRS